MLQILTDYGVELLTSAGVVIAILLGKTKTAEQIQKKRENAIKRKEKKFNKLIAKAKAINEKITTLKEKKE